MPANLTPEYIRADQDYKAAGTPEDRLACLKRMLAVVPKHKGTEKIQADIKHRIARMKEQLDTRKRKKGPSLRVKPEGAGQIMLVGPPNAGKSSLLARLTNAEPEVAAYPCTTREPIPGMVDCAGVQIQVVDLPPVWRGHCETFVFDNIRGCDAVFVVIDLSAPDPASDIRETIDIMTERHIPIVPAKPSGIPGDRRSEIEYMLVLNKADLDPEGEMPVLIREVSGELPPHRIVSARTGMGMAGLKENVFNILHVIRVFSKQPGRPPDHSAPFAVRVGATALDFARAVHQDFANNFKSARVWGKSAKFDGQTVQRTHVLEEGDIVELAISG